MTEDDVDTPPVVTSGDTDVVFESVVLGPGERGEIVLVPDQPMRRPTIFMADRDCEDVVVEEVVHGHVALARNGRWPTEIFRRGQPTDVTVTREEPLKVVVRNTGTDRRSVSASLVDSKEKL